MLLLLHSPLCVFPDGLDHLLHVALLCAAARFESLSTFLHSFSSARGLAMMLQNFLLAPHMKTPAWLLLCLSRPLVFAHAAAAAAGVPLLLLPLPVVMVLLLLLPPRGYVGATETQGRRRQH